jgi:ElaB/YqjD/DUF883 family membrane-anchored ribosome-binding protein
MAVDPQARVPSDLDSISRDLAALKQDFATLISDIRSGTLTRAKTAAYDAAEHMAERATDLYGQAAVQAEKGAKALSHEVEQHPLTTLMVAFAVGFVASRLLSR